MYHTKCKNSCLMVNKTKHSETTQFWACTCKCMQQMLHSVCWA